MFAELRPNSLMLPSRTEPNIRPNSSAELRRLPNFGPSLLQTMPVNSAVSAPGVFLSQEADTLILLSTEG